MPIKLLVVSSNHAPAGLVEAMEAVAGGDLQIVRHLRDLTPDHVGPARSIPVSGTNAKEFQSDRRTYTGAAKDFVLSPDFHPGRDLFVELLERTPVTGEARSHPFRELHSKHDRYHVLLDTIANDLRASGIDQCLFFELPGQAYDIAVYQVARYLGLPVTILSQSVLPGRFFSLKDPKEYGVFVPTPDAMAYPMAEAAGTELFSVQNNVREGKSSDSVTISSMLKLAWSLLPGRPLRALNPGYLRKTLSRIQSNYGALPEWRDPFAQFFHEDRLAYFDHIAACEDKFDLSGEYVYFPLDDCPPITTSDLRGRFRDQATAIECLSAILPEGVRILVKETSSRDANLRGPLFFHRLRRIPSVTILPISADNKSVMKNARFLATVAGMAGWEAIRTGKKALVFGNAWYRKLPGAFEYSEKTTYSHIVSTHHNFQDLEKAVGSLANQAHKGVIDQRYAAVSDEFDAASDNRTVAKSLLGLLRGDLVHTFGQA